MTEWVKKTLNTEWHICCSLGYSLKKKKEEEQLPKLATLWKYSIGGGGSKQNPRDPFEMSMTSTGTDSFMVTLFNHIPISCSSNWTIQMCKKPDVCKLFQTSNKIVKGGVYSLAEEAGSWNVLSYESQELEIL